MKNLKKSIAMILFICLAVGLQRLTAQQSVPDKFIAVKNLVDSQRYVFYATDVLPLSGRQRFLTTDYTVSISKDSIVCDLPYFGRAYTAPIDPAEAGIKFISTNFNYTINPGKKNSWNILIQPKDVHDAQQFNLTIFENGKASLQVNSSDRQPISYNGYIKGKK